MTLDRYAIARTVISTVGAGAVGYFSANPVLAATTLTAIASATNELIGSKTPSANNDLGQAFTEAVGALAESMDGQPDQLDATEALSAISQSIAAADGSAIRDLLTTLPDKAGISTLLQDSTLSPQQRQLAETYLAQALSLWHRKLESTPAITQAFRSLISELQQRVQSLEFAALDFVQRNSVNSNSAPSLLFRPESRVLHLIGRERETHQLLEWCHHPSLFGVQVIAAPGGVGKTRLALSLIRKLQHTGWLAAIVVRNERISSLRDAPLPQDLLLVVDYADYRQDDLQNLIPVLSYLRAKGHRIRLLLLARPDNKWWIEKAEPMFSEPFYEELAQLPASFSVLHPQPAIPSPELSAAVLKQIAKAAGLRIPTNAAPFSLPAKGTPLVWMMAAYQYLHDPETLESNAQQLCKAIIHNHERRYIREKLATEAIHEESVMQALALFTFAGGVDNLQDLHATEKLMRCVPALENLHENSFKHISHVLSSTYPKHNGIDALRPDLLGEYLCENELDDNLLQAFVHWVLQQLQDNHKEDNSHSEWLLHLVSAEQLIERSIQRRHDGVSNLFQRWETMLYAQSYENICALATPDSPNHVDLRDLLLRLNTVQLVTAAEDISRNAETLVNRSLYLAGIGDRESALHAIETATKIVKAAASVDPTTYKPYLAICLTSLAIRHSELGHLESSKDAAEKAIAICQKLYKSDLEPFNAELFKSINVLSAVLSKAGEHQLSLEAAKQNVEIYRQLSDFQPGVFHPGYAMALNNLSNCYMKIGQHDSALKLAEKSFGFYQLLAEKRPEVFNQDLAMSLTNLSGCLSESGKHELALEAGIRAVDIFSQLSEQRPEVFNPDLAKSQQNLAVFFSKLKRHALALEAAERSVDIYRQLASQRPSTFSTELAGSLNGLSNRQSALGSNTAALKASFESVSIRRTLANQNPTAFNLDLAMSVGALTQRLIENGRAVEACDTGIECTRLFAELWLKYPDAYSQYVRSGIQDTNKAFEAANRDRSVLEETLLADAAVAMFIEAQNR